MKKRCFIPFTYGDAKQFLYLSVWTEVLRFYKIKYKVDVYNSKNYAKLSFRASESMVKNTIAPSFRETKKIRGIV